MRIERRPSPKLVVVALAAALAGGALAAVSAGGQGASTATKTSSAAARPRFARGRALRAAASYLGLPLAQLQSDLKAGRSLAEVANSTPGKSAAGLIQALVADRRGRLEQDLGALTGRVSREVNRAGGPGPLAGGARHSRRGARAARARRGAFSTPGRTGLVLTSYLGVPLTQLQSELRSGRTLAEIASATPGKSAAGLIAALVSARKEQLAAAVSSGRLSEAQANALTAKLTARITARVNRKPPSAGSAAGAR